MKKHEPLNSAKALVGLLVFGIAFVLFLKFQESQDYLFTDHTVLRNYVAFAIIACGFLIGLMYLVSQSTHKKASLKSSKRKKK